MRFAVSLCAAALLCGGCVPRQPTASVDALEQVETSQQDAGDPAPVTRQASLGKPAASPWWQAIKPGDHEVFAGANTVSAVWVSDEYRITPTGTRIAFLHWEMAAAPGAPADASLAERSTEEFDCATGRNRVLERYIYTGRMAQGRLQRTDHTAETWRYVQPDTMIDFVAKVVCLAKEQKPTPPKRKSKVIHRPQAAPSAPADYL